MTRRTSTIERATRETRVTVSLDLDGSGRSEIATGIGFLDHMLTALTLHSRIDLSLTCQGDLEVDDHHTVEDTAISLGRALADALGDKSGIRRFADAHAPLDEALARAVIDLSGRPSPTINLALNRESIGSLACENLQHWFVSFAMEARCALHLDVLRGCNDHHKAEAAFKALALALRTAIQLDERPAGAASTKGSLE